MAQRNGISMQHAPAMKRVTFPFRVARAQAAALVMVALAVLVLAASPAMAAGTKVILALGDSLTAGYGLPEGQGFVPQLEAALKADGEDVRIINGGVSADTSLGARERLDWALADNPGYAIVNIGANDMLRGLDPAKTRENIDAILAGLQKAGVKTLLVGMMATPSLGPDYQQAFNGLYPDLAKKYGLDFYPFYLDGVAADPKLNQADGIHPNKDGVAVIVGKMLPAVEKLLASGG
ncbi:arylesterase [Radicibacter daui]|uniref:arylesterase n=1 Tax=Radicibacter daui TaxID=3064829 RepID=UPI004046A77A